MNPDDTVGPGDDEYRCVPCAPVEGDGEENEIVSEETEVEPLRVAPSPQRPSATDVEEHRVTHIPFRSWCRECVEGRALGEQRGHAADACEKKIAVVGVVGMDYFFNTAKGVRRKKAEAMADIGVTDEDGYIEARAEGKSVKNIIIRCSKTKMTYVHTVPAN